MSYTQLVKKWEREYNKKQKEEQKQRKLQKEKEKQFQEAIYIAKGRYEREQQVQAEEKKKEITAIKNNIFASLNTNNPFPYRQYLILWDVLNDDYIQIESDMNKGKINREDITAVFNYIKGFSNEIISGYWNNKLLE